MVHSRCIIALCLLFDSVGGIRIELKTKSNDPSDLGLCEGDCDTDSHCRDGLICFQRDSREAVPGCEGGESDTSLTDYCIDENPNVADLVYYGSSPPDRKFPLGLCEGDCDKDSDCQDELFCFQRASYEPVPGCNGRDSSEADYCVDPSTTSQKLARSTYVAGKLTVRKLGLLLSEGLDARIIATSGERVPYADGSRSSRRFHDKPDAGATFPDDRGWNKGGWIYVSNSETPDRKGGVGALTIDKHGNVIKFREVLKNTSMNCGGGRTPWDTWVSCEEVSGKGKIYQVDPTGERPPQKLTLGSDGGNFESFAYDIRDRNHPRFFVTEDYRKGPLRRFIPRNPNWDDPWTMLHGSGKVEYLVLSPEGSGKKGTYEWTTNKERARNNAEKYYRNSEGIDVKGSDLYFVCKEKKHLFILDLNRKTYTRQSTKSGLFDGAPDQVERILEGKSEMLYFTEEGGKDAGVHARDHNGRFFTILESPVYNDETTGLSFSPDGRFMYIAYQVNGLLFCIWRRDGASFHERQLDVKSHNLESR
eukprot:scaffold1184_cov132-Cylindrotheca_fusiformis.AAC.98